MFMPAPGGPHLFGVIRAPLAPIPAVRGTSSKEDDDPQFSGV